MILFEEDWGKYPEAIIHNSTTNGYARKVATILKKMGNSNHAFVLALHNPRLVNIDPHSDNLTELELGMIVDEIRDNPWYFFREILKAPPASGGVTKTSYRLTMANVAFLWTFFNRIIPYLVQPRQTGKTFNIFGLMTFLMSAGTVNSKLSLLTKDNTLRAESMVILKQLLDNLPWYLQFMDRNDTDNTEKLTINARGMSLRMLVARASAEDADGVGRGLTSPIIGVDEVAVFKNNFISIPVAIASTGAAMDNAKMNGGYYGVFYATTAGKLNTKSGQYAYKVYKGGTRWTHKFYDCQNIDKLLEVIKLNAGSAKGRVQPMLCMEFNHRQLEFTDDWLKKRIALSGAEGVDVETDYLNKWVHSSNEGLLNKDETAKVLASIEDTPDIDYIYDGYMLSWFISKSDIRSLINRPFIIGSDTSDGAGNDEITLCFTDPETGAVLATGRYNEINLLSFAKYLVYLLHTFKKSVLIIERKSSAIGILDSIFVLGKQGEYNIDILKRIFNRVIDDAGPDDDVQAVADSAYIKSAREGNGFTMFKSKFGFATTGSGRYARSNLFGVVMKNAIRLAGDKIRDKILVAQMTSLVIKNGRIDHKSGDHDDLLFAYLLTQWFLQHANHKEFYGLNPMKVFIATTPDSDQEIENRRVVDVKKDMIEIAEQLQVSKIGYKRSRLRDRFTRLRESIKDVDVDDTLEGTIARSKSMDRQQRTGVNDLIKCFNTRMR